MSRDPTRWLTLAMILAVATIGVAIIVYWQNEPERAFERHRLQFEQVQIGMTEEEAIAIMEDGSDVIWTRWTSYDTAKTRLGSSRWWKRSPKHFFGIVVAEGGRVVKKYEVDDKADIEENIP